MICDKVDRFERW